MGKKKNQGFWPVETIFFMLGLTRKKEREIGSEEKTLGCKGVGSKPWALSGPEGDRRGREKSVEERIRSRQRENRAERKVGSPIFQLENIFP